MKKFFSLCTAVSVLLTGLVSCGGGGDDNPGFVTAEEFRAGMGFKLLQNPQFEIVAGYSGDVDGSHPSDSDGNPAIPDTTVPGTGQDEIPNDPNTDEDEGQEYIPPTKLDPVGSMAIVNRTIKAGGSIIGNVDVTYVMTAEDIAVATISAPFAKILENPSFLTGLGIAAENNNGNNWNDNANEQTLSRVRVSNLSACTIKIYFNFKTGQAMVIISASGVEVAGEGNNDEGGFYPGEVVITASSVPFLVTH